jgi:hypothetical protein
MLCTRCHTREALFTPEARAQFEKALELAEPWPIPDGTCGPCFGELCREDPELRAGVRAYGKLVGAKSRTAMVADLRRLLNSGLDLADRIAEHVWRR